MIMTVLLRRGQAPFEVRPDLVCAVFPNDMKPETSTIVNIFGKEYKVRGNHEKVKTLLGWESSGLRVGFDADDVLTTKDLPKTGAVETPRVGKKVDGADKTEGSPTTDLSLD